MKHTFLQYFALKKKMEKLVIFDQDYGQTPLDKCQVFEYLNFSFLWSRKASFF